MPPIAILHQCHSLQLAGGQLVYIPVIARKAGEIGVVNDHGNAIF